MALLGHSLAAYISVLERERLRKLTTRILSDTTLWLCRLFRYFWVSLLPVIQTLLSDLKLFIEMCVRALIIGSTFGSPQQMLLAVSSLKKLRRQNTELFIRTIDKWTKGIFISVCSFQCAPIILNRCLFQFYKMIFEANYYMV